MFLHEIALTFKAAQKVSGPDKPFEICATYSFSCAKTADVDRELFAHAPALRYRSFALRQGTAYESVKVFAAHA